MANIISINIYPYRVFPSAITLGSKHNNLDFLNDTISEILLIIENGFIYKGYNKTLNINKIVCDAPAKAFIKNIIQYNGKYGCDRCDQKSFIIKRDNERRGQQF